MHVCTLCSSCQSYMETTVLICLRNFYVYITISCLMDIIIWPSKRHHLFNHGINWVLYLSRNLSIRCGIIFYILINITRFDQSTIFFWLINALRWTSLERFLLLWPFSDIKTSHICYLYPTYIAWFYIFGTCCFWIVYVTGLFYNESVTWIHVVMLLFVPWVLLCRIMGICVTLIFHGIVTPILLLRELFWI